MIQTEGKEEAYTGMVRGVHVSDSLLNIKCLLNAEALKHTLLQGFNTRDIHPTFLQDTGHWSLDSSLIISGFDSRVTYVSVHRSRDS